MIKAASLPIETNLLSFSRLLSNHGLAHRINEEAGQQVIWVASEAEAKVVQTALKEWMTDSARAENQPQPESEKRRLTLDWRAFGNGSLAAVYYYPLTASLFVVCLLVAAVSGLGAYPDRVAFLFYPDLASEGFLSLLLDVSSPLDMLRTLTPMFLHFGELHLVFNMLWLWYFGRQLESTQSAWSVVLLVLLTSFVSNTTQYMMIDASNFGGMSGVVYGLVGYTFVVHSFMPKSHLSINPSMFVFFVIALVAMEILASSLVATGAHVGGLVSGLIFGLVVVMINRFWLKKLAVGHQPVR